MNLLCTKLLTICGCDNFNILVESSPWLDHRHRNYCGSGTRRSTTVARLNDLVPDSRAASTALELRSAGMIDFFRMAGDNFMIERNLESDSKLELSPYAYCNLGHWRTNLLDLGTDQIRYPISSPESPSGCCQSRSIFLANCAWLDYPLGGIYNEECVT